MWWKKDFIKNLLFGRDNTYQKEEKLTLIKSTLLKISIYFIPLFIIPKKVNLRLNDTKGFSFYLSSMKDLFGKIAEKFGEQLPFSFFDS